MIEVVLRGAAVEGRVWHVADLPGVVGPWRPAVDGVEVVDHLVLVGVHLGGVARRVPCLRVHRRRVGGNAGGVVECHPTEEDTPEVERQHQQQGEDRQDQRELDEGLAS